MRCMAVPPANKVTGVFSFVCVLFLLCFSQFSEDFFSLGSPVKFVSWYHEFFLGHFLKLSEETR